MGLENIEISSYEKENDILLQDILDSNIYKAFKLPPEKQDVFLELNVTATCNQRCEYCYLTKYGEKLYPTEIRNEDVIVNNTKMLLNYFLKNGYNPKKIDLFSGEIWGTSLANKIFNVILEKVSEGLNVKEVMIPSNMTFLLSKKKREVVENYIEQFKDAGIRLCFSASVDGLLIEDTARPMVSKNYTRTGDFYDMLFAWCKKYKYAFHPMISAHSIDKYVENYDWWMGMLRKHRMDLYKSPMFLEVRNDEWTIDSIESYLKLLNHIVDFEFKEMQNCDTEKFANTVIGLNENIRCYSPIVLLNEGVKFNCTIDKSIIVRLGDLAIGACHRTCYDTFQYGKYRIENNEITGVKANNIQLANLVYNCNRNCIMKCDTCPIANMCMRGCLGAQYEANKEILLPCETVCQLFKARLIFLYEKYKKIGVLDTVKNKNISKKTLVQELENSVKALEKGEPNLWKYWKMVTEKII